MRDAPPAPSAGAGPRGPRRTPQTEAAECTVAREEGKAPAWSRHPLGEQGEPGLSLRHRRSASGTSGGNNSAAPRKCLYFPETLRRGGQWPLGRPRAAPCGDKVPEAGLSLRWSSQSEGEVTSRQQQKGFGTNTATHHGHGDSGPGPRRGPRKDGLAPDPGPSSPPRGSTRPPWALPG